jgi:hypothetical protein
MTSTSELPSCMGWSALHRRDSAWKLWRTELLPSTESFQSRMEWWKVFDDGFNQITAHLAAPISGSLSRLRVRELPRLDGLRAAHTVRHPCIH